MSASLLRVAARGSTSTFFRSNVVVARQQSLTARAGLVVPTLLALPSSSNNFSTSARLRSENHEETFEEFTAR
jgi:cytochrome c oxidase subunit 5a